MHGCPEEKKYWVGGKVKKKASVCGLSFRNPSFGKSISKEMEINLCYRSLLPLNVLLPYNEGCTQS